MPGYKRTGAVSSKTRNKRPKRNNFSSVKGPSWSLGNGTLAPATKGFPNSITTRMCYREQLVNLDVGVGGLAASHVFAANGLFDCNITGGGHQPVGFDQMIAMYDHYIVTKAKIVATFINRDPANRQTCAIAIMDDATTYLDMRRVIENGSCTFAELDISGSANAYKTLTLECNPLTYQGRRGKLSDPELKGNSLSNPTELVTFQVVAEPHTAVDAGAVGCSVTIYYDVTFIERKKTDIS